MRACWKYSRESPTFFPSSSSVFDRRICTQLGSIADGDRPQETGHLLKIQASHIIHWLKEYAVSEEWAHVHRLHGLVAEHDLRGDVFICSNLIHTYAACGLLHDALRVFESMRFRDAVAWNSMMKAWNSHGDGERTLAVFAQMQQEGLDPTKATIVVVLKGCGIIESLDECRKLHVFVMWSGFSSEMHVESCLADLYGKCSEMSAAFRMFESMSDRDVVAWNSMMAAYCEQGMHEQSMAMYEGMKQEGICPNDSSVLGMLKACTKGSFLKQGKLVHSQVVHSRYPSHPRIMNTLVDMYAKCHSLKEAREIFGQAWEKSVVSWNVMLMGYTQEGLSIDALELYKVMQRGGVDPDHITYTTVLKSCTSSASISYGHRIHASIVRRGFESDVSTRNALIEMYAACHRIDDALVVFGSIEKKDVSVWNALASAYSYLGHLDHALRLLDQMQRERIDEDPFTFVIKIKACTKLCRLDLGKRLHIRMAKTGWESNELITASLIDMYSKHGIAEEAQSVFDSTPTRDVVCWTGMISAYYHHGMWTEAGALFDKMIHQGLKPDRVSFMAMLQICGSFVELPWGREVHKHAVACGLRSDLRLMNTAVDMYVKCGSLELACEAFRGMPEWNVVSWNILIAGFVEEGDERGALELFRRMCQGPIRPDVLTFIAVLRACSGLGSLEAGRGIRVQIQRQGANTVPLNNTLIDMLAKCGCMDDARRVFDGMKERSKVTWNAMLAGYAQHGRGQEAIFMYSRMQGAGLMPDDATFSSILSACSHEGLRAQAHDLFYAFIEDHLLFPAMEHYSCVVDMLGRAGCLSEGQEFIETIPVQPDPMLRMALLGTCKYHANDAIGRSAFASAIELEPGFASCSILTKIFRARCNQASVGVRWD